MNANVGVMLPRDLPIAELIPFARRAEQLGFDELWVVEDCFYRGGIAQAAAVLASTERIIVGIGILPAAPRNAAFTALEVATLAELFPGRIHAGLGHGVTSWMKQIGAWPASPLGLIGEQLDAIRALLRGEEVTVDGRYVQLDAVVLENPPTQSVPVLAGVRGPKSLAVAGRSADGTILAEPVTVEYLTAAIQQIGATSPHRMVVYEFAAVDDDADAARETARPALSHIGEPDTAAHRAHLPYLAELEALRAESADGHEFAARMPNEWVEHLALVGTAQQVRGRIDELAAAGAHSIVLVPVGSDRLAALESLGRVVGTL